MFISEYLIEINKQSPVNWKTFKENRMIKTCGAPTIAKENKYEWPIRSYVKKETFELIQKLAKQRNQKLAAVVREIIEENVKETNLTNIIRKMIAEGIEVKEIERKKATSFQIRG